MTTQRSTLRAWGHRLGPDLACLLIGLGIWALFRPGLLSTDSLYQYGQARTGELTNWHPPFMTVLLMGWLWLGGDIGGIVLMQCVIGLVGLRRLASGLIAWIAGPRPDGESVTWAGLGVVVVLLVPWTPLLFYLMTFWKDVWLAILFVWIGVAFVSVAFRGPQLGGWGVGWRAVVLMALMAATLLVRHNALVLVPVYVLMTWQLMRRAGRHRPWAWAMVLVVLCLMPSPVLNRCFEVRDLHIGNVIKAQELVGVCRIDPSARKDLPFTDRHLVDEAYRDRYEFGNVWPILWGRPPLVTKGYVTREENPGLDADYRRAMFRHPITLLRVKYHGFVNLLGMEATHYWFHPRIEANKYGLAWSPAGDALRRRLIGLAERVCEHRWLRWLSAVHAAWFVACGMAICAAAMWPSGSADRWLHVVLLLLPFGYYLAYVLAVAAHDFRFLYPSTLFVQVYTLAACVGGVVRLGGRPKPCNGVSDAHSVPDGGPETTAASPR